MESDSFLAVMFVIIILVALVVVFGAIGFDLNQFRLDVQDIATEEISNI